MSVKRLGLVLALGMGLAVSGVSPAKATVCIVADAGGTAQLPPVCTQGYLSPADLHEIVDGLPLGTTIQIGAEHSRFFPGPSGPGGSLGGEFEQFQSFLTMSMEGTGSLSSFSKAAMLPLNCETHIGPRTVGDPVQSFPNLMWAMQGQLPAGDPDFDLLRITAGGAFGMPSPGHTTLTRLGGPGSQWAVDSFFDVFYRIDFIGRPGGPLGGMSGSTTGTIRMQAGEPVQGCCLPNGQCVTTQPTACRNARGKVLPAGVACQGDLDGDGIDDACAAEKCEECGPGPHFIDGTPCPRSDPSQPGVCKITGQTCMSDTDCPGLCSNCPTLLCQTDAQCGGVGGACGTCEGNTCNRVGEDQDTVRSGALLGIDTNFDCVADVNLILGGPATIHKRGPHDDSLRYPGLRFADHHKDVIDTEILAMNLTGGGVTLVAGAGLGAIPLAPTHGAVAEQPGNPSLADSFFDVFVELTDGGGSQHYNQTAIRVQTVVDCLPPKGNYIHFSGCTPLYSSPVLGTGLHTGNLVRANHFTFPDCCLQQDGGACLDNVPVARCADMGGKTVPTCLGDDPVDPDFADEACEKALPTCEPDHDNPTRCAPVVCPDPAQQCVPRVIGLVPCSTPPPCQPQWVVLECDCDSPNFCHPEIQPGPAGPTPVCVGVCPNVNDVCREFRTDTDGDGSPDRFTCDCVRRPPPDPHRTVQGTSVTFGTADVPAIPGDFFSPGSQPFMGTVNLQAGPMDTMIQRSGAMVCPLPPPAPCDPIETELVALDLVSVAPIVVNGPGVTQWNVAVGRSVNPQSTGMLLATKTHPNGGTFDASIMVLPKITFTQVGNPGNVKTIDYGVEGFDPIEINFVEAHWVVNLGPGLLGTIAAPNNGNFVPGVMEQAPGNPLSQVVIQATGNSKGGGVSHPVQPVPVCPLLQGPNDPCAQFQTRDCQQTAPGQVCVPTVVEHILGTPPRVIECGCRDENECRIDFGATGLTCVNACPDPSFACTMTTSADQRISCDCVPPPVACCLPDGTCAVISGTECRERRGKALAAGSICLGDGNGNGIDDACEIGPCGECPKALHWIDETPCPPGDPSVPGVCKFTGASCNVDSECTGVCSQCPTLSCSATQPCPAACGTCTRDVCNKVSADQDTVPSAALVGIDLDGDCIADVNGVPHGPATIHKRGPLDDSSHYPGLRPIDTHKDVIDTEIIQMTLSSPGMVLTAGGGLGQNGNLRSTLGAIAEQPGNPAMADSFFDVFFEVSIGGAPAYNQAPIRVRAAINCVPPKDNYIHVTGCTPLWSSPVAGQGTRVGNLVSANHFTFPDCCFNQQGGACVDNIPVAQCKAQGGKPVPTCLGDHDGLPGDDACKKESPVCEPDPDPAANGRRCRQTTCPDPLGLERCVPTVIGTVPGTSGLVVLECDCTDRCHPEFDAAGQVSCVGACPNSAQVCQRFTLDTDGDGVIDRYTCDCIDPPVVCRPLSDYSGCTPVCNLAGEECVPTLIGPIPGTTQLGVLACDCVAGDRCHIGLNPPPLGAQCEGVCPTGQACKRQPVDTNNDGVDDGFRCDCNDVACEPNDDLSACEPAACPNPTTERCNPKCARWDPLTGRMLVEVCDCTGPNECHLKRGPVAVAEGDVAGAPLPCEVPDNGSGTVDLPPQNCGYVSPDDLHQIIAGLPPGTTINVGAEHMKFFNVTRSPLPGGGESERFDSQICLNMQGTGALGGFVAVKCMPMMCETHVDPRTPGNPVQSFDTDMFMCQGHLGGGDPDFDLLRITAGTGFGMPSPGHTTLTQLPGGNWAVDSFFDITYRIDFVGAPGGPLHHMSGSTTATIRMSTGTPVAPVCVGACPPGQVCRETRTPNEDGTITICCDCVSACPKPSRPVVDAMRKNRVLTISAGDAGRMQTIRVTFVNLPPPFHIWNGRQLYVDNPFDVCEIAGNSAPCPGGPQTRFARLVCTPQCKTDWAAQGMMHVYHEGIVPGGTYLIDVLDCACDPTDPNAKSDPVSATTSRFGDIAGPFVGGMYTGPNGSVDVTTDVIADLSKFRNGVGAPDKARADVEPNCLDFKINISDVTEVLNAFRNLPYRFVPKTPDPCLSPCP